MDKISISVIIPCYNARDFITQAAESALAQPETSEVILIEDGSPDGGLEVCKRIADKHSKVKLLRHPGGINKGAAASRNLGIKNASFPFIAFLDADDYYLPNRFAKTVEVIYSNEYVDGVYEAIGATFDDESSKSLWSTLTLKDVTTVTKEVCPSTLFIEMLIGKVGYFSPDGLTVRKSLLQSTGLFNENLSIMEDTDMIFKLSAKGNLYPGNIKQPVAMRRVHKGNRITYHLANFRESYFTQRKMWKSLYEWGLDNLSQKQMYYLSRRYAERLRKVDYLSDLHIKEFIESRREMWRLIKVAPNLLLNSYFLRIMLPSKQIIKRKLIVDN